MAEVVGTFILVFAGTAVAVVALLGRPTAGPSYYSLGEDRDRAVEVLYRVIPNGVGSLTSEDPEGR